MTATHKALLLSLFVFPGAGLWALGQRGRAMVFALPAAVAVIYLFQGIWQIAMSLAEQSAEAILRLDFASVFAQVHTAVAQAEQLQTPVWVFIAAWILGLASTYSVGKLQEQKQLAAAQAEQPQNAPQPQADAIQPEPSQQKPSQQQ